MFMDIYEYPWLLKGHILDQPELRGLDLHHSWHQSHDLGNVLHKHPWYQGYIISSALKARLCGNPFTPQSVHIAAEGWPGTRHRQFSCRVLLPQEDSFKTELHFFQKYNPTHKESAVVLEAVQLVTFFHLFPWVMAPIQIWPLVIKLSLYWSWDRVLKTRI